MMELVYSICFGENSGKMIIRNSAIQILACLSKTCPFDENLRSGLPTDVI